MVEAVFQEENDCNVSVIPIISKPGIVKTTLAQFIYVRIWVQLRFESITWVRVYELCGRRRVRVKIDGHKYNEYYSELSFLTDELKDLLKKQTAGKRFLVVLEDPRSVEDEEYWRYLKELSSGGQSGSKVIIITSDEEAAKKMGTKPPFRWDSSSDQFDEDQFIDEFCVETGTPKHVILKWLASAISENDDRAWKVTATNTILDILQFNYGDYFWKRWSSERSNRKDDQLDKIEIDRSLFQSYINLPLHLKQCFEYCRLFPQDYEIDVQTLINLWMAQGFIKLSDDSSRCLEDVGLQYFEVLLKGGFFKEVHHDESDHTLNSSVTRCKIGCSGYYLLILLGGVRHVMLHPPYECNYIDADMTSHLSFDFHLHSPRQIPKTIKDNSNVFRSILLPRQSWSKYEQGRIDPEKILHVIAPHQSGWESVNGRPGLISNAIISRFRNLRTLDLHDSGIKVVPNYINQLKLLRFLDLSRNADIKTLPVSITKLVYLQTLKLSHCIGLKELPEDVKNLVNLQSLETDGCYNMTHMPRGLGQLTSVCVLPQFVVNKDVKDSSSDYGKTGGLNELEKLNNLRGNLQIKNLMPRKDAKAAVLEAKPHLQVLVLDWDVGQTKSCTPSDYEEQLEDLKPHLNLKGLTLYGYGGSKLSSWLNPQKNLVKLVLRKCWNRKYLPPLSLFLKLEVLVLNDMPKLEYVENKRVSSSTTFFPALQELWLTELPKLQGWWSVSLENEEKLPSFPRLFKLVIQDCPKLASMPLFPTLEEGLVLDSTCLNPLQLTMKQKSASSSTTTLPSPLSKLKNLSIAGIDKFDNTKAGEIAWGSLGSLQMLKLNSLPELTTLPEGLQRVTTLKQLHVGHCGLNKFPAWIAQLENLEKLVIRACPMLKTLPGEIRSLETSEKMEIDDCPNLYRSRLAYD